MSVSYFCVLVFVKSDEILDTILDLYGLRYLRDFISYMFILKPYYL